MSPWRLNKDSLSVVGIPSISFMAASRVFSYRAACSGLSDAYTSSSILSGRSEMIFLSVFILRIMNGAVTFLKRSAQSPSFQSWIGFA